ncbi:MAG: hypothetical protein KJN77_07705 [Gammaproteobacteria bacterium]|nr:hypothetical protein [Gammaproteobacteria bacterium]
MDFSVKTHILLLACVGACQSESAPPATVATDKADNARSCGEQGFLSATLFGSIERELHWGADELECDNMLRPDGEGIRVRFTGDAANRAVAIILALPDLERGQDGSELPTVVTLTVEGSGRFFSTADLSSCFTDIRAQPVAGQSATQYDARGTMYCVEPLGEINGAAAVSIPKLEFQTRIAWESDDP